MRSRSRVAAWVVGLTVTATVWTLGCGSGSQSGLQLNAVAFGNGTFVAVGESATAFTNQGNGYTPFTTGVPTLSDVTYSVRRALFVAVGDGGAIVISPDGVTWGQQLSPTGVNLHGVVAVPGRPLGVLGQSTPGVLVAVGDEGTILTSPDGVVWTQQTSGTDAPLYGVGFGGSIVVAVGGGGAVVISSDFGLTWQSTLAGPTNDLNAVAFGTGGWVAVGQGGLILQGTTPDAWQVVAISVLPNLNDVIFTQNLFVVVGDNGHILNSADGVNYGGSVSNTGQFLFGAAYGNGGFVVVGSGGRVLTSGDASVFQEGKI